MCTTLRPLVRTVAAAAGVLLLAGCAGVTRQRASAPDPRVWTAMSCASCEDVKVDVQVRSSVKPNGEAGSYTYARVRNRNSYPVVLTVDFVPDEAPVHDDYVPGESYRVTLQAAGVADAESTILMRAARVASVSVRSVERF